MLSQYIIHNSFSKFLQFFTTPGSFNKKFQYLCSPLNLSICPNCSDVQASLQISWVDDINFHLLLMNPWFPTFGPLFLKMLFKGPIIFALIFPCLPFISRFYVRTFLEVIWTFLILEVWIPFDRDSNFLCIFLRRVGNWGIFLKPTEKRIDIANFHQWLECVSLYFMKFPSQQI